eukprot:4262186-Pyramimonas_sp.AAC.1
MLLRPRREVYVPLSRLSLHPRFALRAEWPFWPVSPCCRSPSRQGLRRAGCWFRCRGPRFWGS